MARQAQNLDPDFPSQRCSLAHCFILVFSVECQYTRLPPLSSCSSGNLLVGYVRSDGEMLLPRGCVVWCVTRLVTLCDFLYGSALSRECCGVSKLVVFWIQSRTAFDCVESNTKKSIQKPSLDFCKEPHS